MAGSNCLLQFDSIVMDVNENPSDTYNHVILNDTTEQSEIVSSIVDSLSLSNDFTLCESLNSSAPLDDSTEKNESDTELHVDKLIIQTQNSNDVNNTRNSDSGIHDSENNVAANDRLIDFSCVDMNLSNECEVAVTKFNNEDNDAQARDEEFHDAVQFFKDPSSLNFLENAGTTNAPTDSLITRSSLYMNFDPLHTKFCSQPASKPNELQEIAEVDVEPDLQRETAENENTIVINNHLSNVSPRQSLGNILISFDSPVVKGVTDPEVVTKFEPSKPQKLYTEEELQQLLKIQELSMQDVFLKRQHDLELERSQKEQEMEEKLKKQNLLCLSLNTVLKEVIDVACILDDKHKKLQENFKNLEKESTKLKEDLKTSGEDLQSVESTFSDFHKRYEQCKNMLKVYTQNEDNLKQQLEALKVQLHEKDEIYKILQTRTQEMLDKANTEVSNCKKGNDAQVAVLKAQLKKAELKISSLESDIEHVKIENVKLGNICDELMAKVTVA